MDRHYFYQNHAREHQRDIEHELADRSLLREVGRGPLGAREPRQLVWRVAPIVITLAAVLLLAFVI